MSDLLDRALAAHKAIRKGHGVSYTQYNGKFMRAMAASRPAPKYRNAEIWKKYRDPICQLLSEELQQINNRTIRTIEFRQQPKEPNERND